MQVARPKSVIFSVSLPPVGGRVGHPEAGSDRIRRPLRRDLQRRQQAQTLHSHCNDWLPGAGAACELANDEELESPLFGFLGFMQGFINEMVHGSRWEAIWVQSSLASNVLHWQENSAVQFKLA